MDVMVEERVVRLTEMRIKMTKEGMTMKQLVMEVMMLSTTPPR